MRTIDYRIISLGTLAANPLWDERSDVRTGHATTTLISAGEAKIIVNPALPPRALEARMSERTPVRPADITHVFITTFVQDHYRGLPLFDQAQWLLHEPERDAARAALDDQMVRARENGDPDLVRLVSGHRELLRKCGVADDHLVRDPNVDLFPLPGVTPGTCGLLIPQPQATVLICGDAIATAEHLEQGKVLPICVDVEQAQESFREAIEIADILVLGRDNVCSNPLRRMA
jgi:glyoxylase-like metal-dependent hydrolase (beta-lactamase superfamily II)